MIEPELKEQLEAINKNVVELANRVGGSWKAFWQGLLRGLGSVIGVAIALALVGWILNTLGYIPAFRDEVNSWKETINRVQESTPLKSSK